MKVLVLILKVWLEGGGTGAWGAWGAWGSLTLAGWFGGSCSWLGLLGTLTFAGGTFTDGLLGWSNIILAKLSYCFVLINIIYLDILIIF